MTEQVPSDQVTLDDLKRAIQLVPKKPEYATWDGSANDFDVEMHLHIRSSRNAWHVAFEWRHSFRDSNAPDEELHEGMRLIRESLS